MEARCSAAVFIHSASVFLLPFEDKTLLFLAIECMKTSSACVSPAFKALDVNVLIDSKALCSHGVQTWIGACLHSYIVLWNLYFFYMIPLVSEQRLSLSAFAV